MAETRGNFIPAFSDEMFEQITLDVYEYVKSGTLSKKKVIGIANEMIEKRDDEGNLVYYDIRCKDEKKPILLTTMIGRIRLIIQDWKKYVAPLMQPLLLEAVYQHVTKAKDSTQSFKVASDMIMPKESADDGNKLTLSPGALTILQQNPVGTTIAIGQGGGLERTGDTRYERPHTVHPVADGQRQDTAIEAIPSEHDKPIHGVPEGDDTAQRDIVSDTPLPPEDTVDNDSGGDMDFIERPRRVSSG